MSFLAGTDRQLAAKAHAITPSDSTDVTHFCTAGLLVIANGGVHVRTTEGVDIDLGNWQLGQVVPVQCTRVLAATGATVLGLYY